MRKAKFIQQVLIEKPELINVDTFFFIKPYEHILSGFCCEITPHGACVWKFVYPLFFKFQFLTLTYSRRINLPDGYIDFDLVDKKTLASEFLIRIKNHYEEAHRNLELNAFCNLFSSDSEYLKHETGHLIYGYAMLLLGNKDAAIEHLGLALKNNVREPYFSECQSIFDLVQVNMKEAQSEILKLEHQMKEELGIS